jgi:undecaprenyl-diphosphatase
MTRDANDEAAPDGQPPGVEGELTQDRFVGGRDLTHWRTRAGAVVEDIARWIGARIGPYTALVITLLVGIALVVALSVAAVEVYDAVTDEDGVAGVDEPLLHFMLTLRSPGLDFAVTAFTDIAGTIGMPIIAVLGMVVLGLTRRSWTPVVVIGAAGTGSLLMTIAGKELIQRERPPLTDAVPPFEYSPSFPSGHTLNAVAVIGAIAYLLVLRRTTRAARIAIVGAAAVFALFVGLSRVYLGHHWFTDVLVGWILGALWLALIITAHRLYLTIREQPRHRAAAIS